MPHITKTPLPNKARPLGVQGKRECLISSQIMDMFQNSEHCVIHS